MILLLDSLSGELSLYSRMITITWTLMQAAGLELWIDAKEKCIENLEAGFSALLAAHYNKSGS